MPRIRKKRGKKPPDGWSEIEETLLKFGEEIKEAEEEDHEGKRKPEAVWPIFQLHHRRSRFIFDLFYKKKAISRELYEYCL